MSTLASFVIKNNCLADHWDMKQKKRLLKRQSDVAKSLRIPSSPARRQFVSGLFRLQTVSCSGRFIPRTIRLQAVSNPEFFVSRTLRPLDVLSSGHFVLGHIYLLKLTYLFNYYLLNYYLFNLAGMFYRFYTKLLLLLLSEKKRKFKVNLCSGRMNNFNHYDETYRQCPMFVF